MRITTITTITTHFHTRIYTIRASLELGSISSIDISEVIFYKGE
jgi:hypothetical protein